MESMKITEGIREIKKQLKENGYSEDAIKNLVNAYLQDVEEGYDVEYNDYILPKVYEFVI